MSFEIRVDESLVLRLIQTEHAPELVSVVQANVEHVGRWLPWCTAGYDEPGCVAWIESWQEAYRKGRQLPLSIVENGRIVGGTGFMPINIEDNPAWGMTSAVADIGYWLAKDALGRGVVTRSVEALVGYGFQGRKLDRITIRAEPENIRSCAVAERLGFAFEGINRHVAKWKGRWVDHRVYAVLAEDWAGRAD